MPAIYPPVEHTTTEANSRQGATLPRPGGRSAFLGRVAPALGLVLLAPLIAEFVLGNIAIDGLGYLMVFIPLYGAGALLIREVTRRASRGWPTMLVLGLAYGLVEEGLVTQTLFNPSYVGLHLLAVTFIPALGIGAWWTVFVLTLHTVWSMGVSIALTEALVPDRSTTPWLGGRGLALTAVVFALGVAMNFAFAYQVEQFIAMPWQLAGTGAIIGGLIAVAFTIGRHPRPRAAGVAPSPWLVGGVSLVTSTLFMVGSYAPSWAVVAAWLVLFVAVGVLVWRWSQRRGWGQMQNFALAAGALLTYVWHSFPQPPVLGTPGTVDMIGNAIFALGALGLLVLGWYRITRTAAPA